MTREFTFGAGPERLKRLLFEGLEAPEGQEDAALAGTEDATPSEGQRIGCYRLLRVLGEGGMGVVYLAEQEDAIRRRVALKVIKPGMDSKRVIARFENERQALALMDHPSIAQVYDAGTTEAGRPYFAMEYVKGSPITEYCDRHKLGIEDRLRLFQQVCAAVHHAHQRGIIHRDIKPSNILVSTEADTATPKIIDFGVAKATGKSLTERTLYTEDSQLLGTPEYMSPEQADMVNEDIDTRSDIYSLGALLYVLLAGILPYDSETFRQGGVEHVRKMIRETDPKTPSTRLTKLGREASELAELRRMEVRALAKRLHKELEWIPLKAMRKDRSERYRSAIELADDIGNYLNGAPLIAGPPGTLYRFKKFVRRNAGLSAAVLAVAVVLILGLAGTTAMYFRADRLRVEAQASAEREASARAEAERALAQAQAVSDFLVKDILGEESFSEAQELDFDHVLDITSEKLEGKFLDQPLVAARILHAVGQRYYGIGKFELARKHLERAYQIRLQHLGPEHSHVIRTANTLCFAYWNLDRHDDAIRIWNKQIDILGKAYGETYGWRMLFMHNIGTVYMSLGRRAEAEALFDEVLALCERSSSTRRYFVLFVTRYHQGKNYLAQERY